MTSESISQEARESETPADSEIGLNADQESAAAIESEPLPEGDYDIYSDDGDEYEHGYRYCPGPDNCEDHEMYQPGGLHPVQIEDCIENRYIIVHKLGCGGSSTVWLARDNVEERYVALKFVTAKMSGCAEAEAAIYRKLHDSLPEDVREDFLLPLYDSFWINGPNGKHLCLAMGISGPSLASFREGRRMKIRPDLVNVVAAQVVEGLSHLHDAGLVYGDLSAGNIAFTLPKLDHFSIQDLYNIFGYPEEFEVQANYDEDYDWCKIHAPAYVSRPLDFTGELPVGLLRPEVTFIDFGGSRFLDSEYGLPGFGYTISYADPPCLYFGERPSQESDKWALACILFELRSAVELFPQNEDGVWSEIVDRLGPIPQSWEEEEEVPGDDTADRHAEDDGGMVADVNEEDSKDKDVEENDQSLPHADLAGFDDDGSADRMEVTEDITEQSVAQREHLEVGSAWKSLPRNFNELIRFHLMQRAQALLMKLGVHSWKQYCVNLLGSIRSRFQSNPATLDASCNALGEVLETEPAPSSPTPNESETPMLPGFWVPKFFNFRGDDRTLHGQIANIGNHHPWHSLTIEERRERLERFNTKVDGTQKEFAVDTSDEGLDRGPPPPDKLSSEEAADFEELLTKLLTWERSDRASLQDIREHPWLVKEYAPCSSEPWLQRYFLGASYIDQYETYI